MKAERFLPHLVAVSLLVLGAVYKSPAMAYAAVLAVGLVLGREAFEQAHAEKAPTGVPEDLKRKIVDLEARVTTIEYGIRQRGF